MLRRASPWIVIMVLAGCRAPAPSFNAFAPYGSPHVPPPTTGSVGTPGSYYQAPATAPSGAPPVQPPTTMSPTLGTQPTTSPPSTWGTPPTTTMPPTLGTQPPTYNGASNQAGPTAASGVAQASYQQPATGASRSVLVSGSTSSSSSLQLNGMRVNDGTQPAEPQSFTPASSGLVEISDLPPANPNQPPTTMRVIQPTTTSTSTATSSSNSWQARDGNSP